MKILQSQRRLENNGLAIGLLVSILLHGAAVVGLYGAFETQKPQAVNMTKISLDLFNIGGGKSDLAPVEEVVEEIIEEPIVEEKPLVEDKIVEEIVKAPEPEKIPEKKLEPKKKEKKSEKKKDKPKKQKQPQKAGNNAINPSANSIASSPITSNQPVQNLSNSEKANIGATIQAIIAAYAKNNYPRQARVTKKQGTVTVSFSYSPDGTISNISITKSSGHSVLDKAVITAIEKTKHKFPKPSIKTEFIVPVKFTIIQ